MTVTVQPGWRWNVLSLEQLRALSVAPLPGGIAASAPVRSLHRDLYLDTVDGVLRARGVALRLRLTADDRQTLSLMIHEAGSAATCVAAVVHAADPAEAVQERNTVTRRLRGIVDPQRLGVRIELEVERATRTADRDWIGRPRVELHYDNISIRRESSVRTFQQLSVHARRDAARVARLAALLERELGLRPAEPPMQRAELLLKWMPLQPAGAPEGPGAHGAVGALGAASGEMQRTDPDFLHPELSFLQSQWRVLAMADDARVPLAERLRFVAIVAANLDEFFMTRVAGLKFASPELAEESTGAWGDVVQQLAAICAAARALQDQHYAVAAGCLAAAAPHGVRIRSWEDLTAEERDHLRERYREDIHPALTPLAMTMSPGHPFPRLPHLSLSMAAVLRDAGGGASHFAQVEIPDDLPRVLRAHPDDATLDVVPIEAVIRANLGALYPGVEVEHAYFLRVTRSSLLALDETQASDLLEAMDDATRRRPDAAVVRIEVERAMPPLLRELVVDEMRRERGTAHGPLGMDDVYEVDGLLDLRALADLELPASPALRYPVFSATSPVPAGESLLSRIASGDLLVHHPFESFDETVVRFVCEAAADPSVTIMKMTLYRVGEHSPIVDALRAAARSGKQVYAFVELRARFDEERNVKWVRALEKAGVHVAYGLVGLKTHAKGALVVRREAGRLRRYVHVGTGNYNPNTGRAYTDLSLFSADEHLAADVADLFNSLTGSSAPLDRTANGALVAPAGMLTGLLSLIEHEAANARAGHPAAIRIKVNGLSDPEVVRALERAADDGVVVDLVVRGICTLRPPPRGAGRPVRVVATTGRFLEHSRIYHFANGGSPRYYIGSADLRPRNLRRRVELLAPVHDASACARLDALLTLYLSDPTAWELGHDGSYVQRLGSGPGAQDALLTGAAGPPARANAKWEHALSPAAR